MARWCDDYTDTPTPPTTPSPTATPACCRSISVTRGGATVQVSGPDTLAVLRRLILDLLGRMDDEGDDDTP
jgi:hypothetical protein